SAMATQFILLAGWHETMSHARSKRQGTRERRLPRARLRHSWPLAVQARLSGRQGTCTGRTLPVAAQDFAVAGLERIFPRGGRNVGGDVADGAVGQGNVHGLVRGLGAPLVALVGFDLEHRIVVGLVE